MCVASPRAGGRPGGIWRHGTRRHGVAAQRLEVADPLSELRQPGVAGARRRGGRSGGGRHCPRERRFPPRCRFRGERQHPAGGRYPWHAWLPLGRQPRLRGGFPLRSPFRRSWRFPLPGGFPLRSPFRLSWHFPVGGQFPLRGQFPLWWQGMPGRGKVTARRQVAPLREVQRRRQRPGRLAGAGWRKLARREERIMPCREVPGDRQRVAWGGRRSGGAVPGGRRRHRLPRRNPRHGAVRCPVRGGPAGLTRRGRWQARDVDGALAGILRWLLIPPRPWHCSILPGLWRFTHRNATAASPPGCRKAADLHSRPTWCGVSG